MYNENKSVKGLTYLRLSKEDTKRFAKECVPISLLSTYEITFIPNMRRNFNRNGETLIGLYCGAKRREIPAK